MVNDMKSPFDLKANIDYTLGRFNNTVVMYDGIPTRIVDMNNNLDCHCESMHGNFKANLLNENFSFEAIPLGYTRMNGELKFLSRKPNRQWKQGLSTNSFGVGKKPCRITLQQLVTDSVFIGTAMNKFDTMNSRPKYSTDFKVLSRTIAIDSMRNNEGVIKYRGNAVGFIEGTQAVMMGRHSFLTESLEELGVHVVNK